MSYRMSVHTISIQYYTLVFVKHIQACQVVKVREGIFQLYVYRQRHNIQVGETAYDSTLSSYPKKNTLPWDPWDWYFYLPLPFKSTIHVAEYTIRPIF